ncbi:UDP-N-acetylglucosamine--N-acetylmuramyl-(pentapeptide) pyrophosphoryl-undecaprenol N-acetylglucosamine transferase [Lebetimonas natsushimae]|uniref:UDP-N-acetylglucosamine--N-acetylmuramyl-(pentapeptide) pyrophosphoryl-undecaprenol N-acetylglucosamine transferase n=1 Tax=Lebetimonas natsushimae TaxID=1936991 RepID=A0A292YAQ6_9BACT|nr:undecaprenyldiphospho-muramoylpentapeptide beta-N-acetylglucosaminyltransferase [Lebetimonas natsushimae]GAX86818.1 UDP-N-acetylglucosamine--N-acetylmuramyl-(pentapeptide) pyrophosphoryl-undecaprenol N-acetylglucosamine transferase [Lebetimonas natsushimae]
MENKKLKIAITGGGTGGHLKIAKVIKEELNKRGLKPIYIGSTNGADKKWFEKDMGFSKKYFLSSKGVVNKKGLNKIISLINIFKLSLKAKKILQQNKINAVFSVGGYSAAPASFAALLLNRPLFIHEQNAYIGSLNKLLKPFSKRFFSTFLYNDPYPVEEIFFEKKRIRKELKTVIFLGGSQGAVAINNLAISLAPILKEKNINIIHQTGKKDYERIKEFYEKNAINADIFDFSKNLADKITKADFAISRAGASTMFELVANNIPAIFIPYPYAAGDHQYYNARFLEEKNAGFVIREEKIKKEKILEILFHSNLEEISKNLSKTVQKNGAEFIVDEIIKTLHQ